MGDTAGILQLLTLSRPWTLTIVGGRTSRWCSSSDVQYSLVGGWELLLGVWSPWELWLLEIKIHIRSLLDPKPALNECLCGSDITQNHTFTEGFEKCFKPYPGWGSQGSAISWVGLSKAEGAFLPKDWSYVSSQTFLPSLTLPEGGQRGLPGFPLLSEKPRRENEGTQLSLWPKDSPRDHGRFSRIFHMGAIKDHFNATLRRN